MLNVVSRRSSTSAACRRAAGFPAVQMKLLKLAPWALLLGQIKRKTKNDKKEDKMTKKDKKEIKREFTARQCLQLVKTSGRAHQDARVRTKVPQDVQVTTPRLPFSNAGPLRWLLLMLCCTACSAHGVLEANKPSHLVAIDAHSDSCSDDPAAGYGSLKAQPPWLSQSARLAWLSSCELRDLARKDDENVTWIGRSPYRPSYIPVIPDHEEWFHECILTFNETGWRIVLSPHHALQAWNRFILEPDRAILWWIFMGWIAWFVNPDSPQVRRISPQRKPKKRTRKFKSKVRCTAALSKELDLLRYCIAFSARRAGPQRLKCRRHVCVPFKYRVQKLRGKTLDFQAWRQRCHDRDRLVRNFGNFSHADPMQDNHNDPLGKAMNWTLSQTLAGGAYGSHQTKRRRKRRQQESPSWDEQGDDKLAHELLTLLNKWEQKPQKTKRQPNKPMSLAGTLMQVLQRSVQQQDKDHVVAQKIKSSLGTWTRNRTSHGSQNPAWPQVSQQETSGPETPEPNTWYRNPSNPPHKRAKVTHEKHSEKNIRQVHMSEHQKTAQQSLPTGLAPSEWSSPPKTMAKTHMINCLREGKDLPGNVVFIHHEAEAQELKDLWQSLAVDFPVLAIRAGSEGGLGAKFVRASIKWPGNSKFTLATLATWNIGKSEAVITHKPPQSTNIAKFEPTPKVFVRISAPSHYRKQFLNQDVQDSAQLVLSHICGWKKVPTTILTGGSWKWEWGKCSEQLVGHIKLTPAHARELETCSGMNGIFITETKVHSRSESIMWIERNQNETREDYYRRVVALAKGRTQSLKYRRNGGHDLGVIKKDTDPHRHAPLMVDIQGVPRTWDGEDITLFMTAQKWSDISVVNRRRVDKTTFRWTVKAKPPEAGAQGPWNYVDEQNSDLTILVSKATWSARAPQTLTVPGPQRLHGKTEHVNDNPPQTARVTKPLASQPVTPRENKVNDDNGNRGRSRSPPRTTSEASNGTTKEEAIPPPSLHLQPGDIEWLAKEGWTRVNQGGTGDCGFRSLSAAIHWTKSFAKQDDEASRREGAILRSMCFPHSKKLEALEAPLITG